VRFEIWQASLQNVPAETIPTGVFPFDLYRKVYEGETEKHGLDGIFSQFQKRPGTLLDELERKGEAGQILHNMRVGDIIIATGRVFRCAPVGWDDITVEWARSQGGQECQTCQGRGYIKVRRRVRGWRAIHNARVRNYRGGPRPNSDTDDCLFETVEIPCPDCASQASE